MNWKAIFLMGALAVAAGANSTSAEAVTGSWINEEQTAKIEIYSCGQEYCGKFAWMKDPVTDKKNPDPALRSRSMVGVEVMTGFRFDGEQWSGGQFYLARRGKPADASWKLISADELELTVKVMGSRRSTWTRAD